MRGGPEQGPILIIIEVARVIGSGSTPRRGSRLVGHWSISALERLDDGGPPAPAALTWGGRAHRLPL